MFLWTQVRVLTSRIGSAMYCIHMKSSLLHRWRFCIFWLVKYFNCICIHVCIPIAHKGNSRGTRHFTCGLAYMKHSEKPPWGDYEKTAAFVRNYTLCSEMRVRNLNYCTVTLTWSIGWSSNQYLLPCVLDNGPFACELLLVCVKFSQLLQVTLHFYIQPFHFTYKYICIIARWYFGRFKQHQTDFTELPEERPILLPCKQGNCKCFSYHYVPLNGGQPIRCSCKHTADNHSAMEPYKCKNSKGWCLLCTLRLSWELGIEWLNNSQYGTGCMIGMC